MLWQQRELYQIPHLPTNAPLISKSYASLRNKAQVHILPSFLHLWFCRRQKEKLRWTLRKSVLCMISITRTCSCLPTQTSLLYRILSSLTMNKLQSINLFSSFLFWEFRGETLPNSLFSVYKWNFHILGNAVATIVFHIIGLMAYSIIIKINRTNMRKDSYVLILIMEKKDSINFPNF